MCLTNQRKINHNRNVQFQVLIALKYKNNNVNPYVKTLVISLELSWDTADVTDKYFVKTVHRRK